MKSEHPAKSRLKVMTLLGIIIIAAVSIPLIVGGVRTLDHLDRDRFIIQVTSERINPVRDVKIRGLGAAGEIGLILPGETKTLIIEQRTFEKNSTLSWVDSSGSTRSILRPDEWGAGSVAEGKIFILTMVKSGEVAYWAGKDLTPLEELKFIR